MPRANRNPVRYQATRKIVRRFHRRANPTSHALPAPRRARIAPTAGKPAWRRWPTSPPRPPCPPRPTPTPTPSPKKQPKTFCPIPAHVFDSVSQCRRFGLVLEVATRRTARAVQTLSMPSPRPIAPKEIRALLKDSVPPSHEAEAA